MILRKSDPDGSERTRPAVGALLIEGAHGSLAIARSLGRRGIPVCFLTDDHPLAGFSRYVQPNLRWSGPSAPQGLDDLLLLARQRGLDGWVLFPGRDDEVRFVAQNHAALASLFRLTTPPWDAVRFACDKRLTYERAQALGIDIPRSWYPASVQELAGIEFRFPVILKPTVHSGNNPFSKAKAWRADDRTSLVALYRRAAALAGEQSVVVQELIPGSGAAQFSYAAACWNGAPIGSLVARRGRQYPIDFGFTSTFVETVEQPDVEAAARRFIAALCYTGLVEIEFKFDHRDGRHKLLDVNPRSWTWAALGPAAGVDFAALLWRLALGEAVDEVRARPGIAWMHSARDLVAACQELAAGTLTAREYLRSLGRCRVLASFAIDDPLPGLVELPLALARAFGRRRRARISRGAAHDGTLARPAEPGLSRENAAN